MKTLLFSISLFLISLFLVYSYQVKVRGFVRTDFDITVKVQDHLPKRVDLVFSLLSLLGSIEVTGIVWISILALSLFRGFYKAIFGLLLLPIALIIEVWGKLFIFHPSPPHLFYRGILPFNFPSSYVHTDYSYPSGHMLRTSFLAFFLITWALLRQRFFPRLAVTCTLLTVTFIMALSRIYLGEHWFSDVVGGTLLGSSLGILSALAIPPKKVYS